MRRKRKGRRRRKYEGALLKFLLWVMGMPREEGKIFPRIFT